jgi:hypothetical protein
VNSPGKTDAHTIVSAFCASKERIEDAVEHLTGAGIPRDLVEVVVSESAARRHYEGHVRALGTLALSGASKGALVGLFAGIIVSLETLLLPGFDLPRPLSLVQLLGPNVGAMAGAIIGGLVGALWKRKPRGVYARVSERDAILIVVLGRSPSEASSVARVLTALGGEDVRIGEPETGTETREVLFQP